MQANSNTLYRSNIKSFPLSSSGKVRDIYNIDDKHLLIVTSDRLSAFDVILPDPIPGKGSILTEVSNFWFKRCRKIIPNHLSDLAIEDVIDKKVELEMLKGRAVVVRKLKPLPIEAVIRGYLIGSGWEDYKRTGKVCGVCLPAGLKQAEKLPEPIFTPATKANVGDHDENIDFESVKNLIGDDFANQIRNISLKIYSEAVEYAIGKGIIIADTKFEFGFINNEITLIDEALTPDSSRFWDVNDYAPGKSQDSYDKQIVRDWLETTDWNKEPPSPNLPKEIIDKTYIRYKEALETLTN